MGRRLIRIRPGQETDEDGIDILVRAWGGDDALQEPGTPGRFRDGWTPRSRCCRRGVVVLQELGLLGILQGMKIMGSSGGDHAGA